MKRYIVTSNRFEGIEDDLFNTMSEYYGSDNLIDVGVRQGKNDTYKITVKTDYFDEFDEDEICERLDEDILPLDVIEPFHRISEYGIFQAVVR